MAGGNPQDLREFLVQFVTEAGNPENCKGVLQVEVFYPSPLLQAGVVLIDTPGIGSTLRHNTEAALNFLPQCDAALFLMSADPPITEVEVKFLQAIRPRVTHLFFVLNKVDYLSEEEVSSLRSFLERVLQEEVGIDDPLVFPVSARLALEGRQKSDGVLLERSGIREVLKHLLAFLREEKSYALRVALAKKTVEVLDGLVMHLSLLVRSLEMPLCDLGERLQVFSEKIKEAEEERIRMGDLLLGERKRMVALLEEQAESLRQKARAHFQDVVEKRLAGAKGDLEADIREALEEEIPAFFEHELSEVARVFEEKFVKTLQPYERKIRELTEAVRGKAAELFDIPHYVSQGSETFVMEKKPYWVTHKWYTHFSFLPEGLFSALLPERARRAKLRQQIQKEIEELVTTNVENLRWATLQNLDQTFRQFVAVLDEHLEQTITATQGAIERARSKRLEEGQNIVQELERLHSAFETFQALRECFSSWV